jgi:hypothetical protein
MNRSAIVLLLLSSATASCARQMNGTDGTRGRTINVKLKPDAQGACVVDNVNPERVVNLKPRQNVSWRVSNSCKDDTDLTIVFDSLDPVMDDPGNPGHKKRIPKKGIILDGVGVIQTTVGAKDPGGAEHTSKAYRYRASTPGSDVDPEIVVDWP